MDTIAETIKFAGFGKKKAMAKQIQMFDKAIIDDVPAHIALEIKVAIENLKSMAKTSSAPTGKVEKDMYDVADEIRELKDLLDDGIVTQDEFNTKKKQLLGI